jgi:hypothetical protein
VGKFSLKIVGASYTIPEEVLAETYNKKEKQANKLNGDELMKKEAFQKSNELNGKPLI